MKIKIVALFLAISIALCGCQKVEPQDPAAPQPPVENPSEPQQPEPAPAPPEPLPNVKVSIMAVGDNLLHNTVSGSVQSGDSFDYAALYTKIAPYAQKADIAFINQEVPLAGPVGRYPMLSAPGAVADGLIKTGFNVANQATNHSLDKGEKGLLASIDALKAAGLEAVLGCFTSAEEASKQIILEKQGIRFGFLSYTYGTNGIPVPGGKEYLVSLIDEQKMQTEISALRQQCDYVIVSMHWGAEYQTSENETQNILAQKASDFGADMIIGHHPHVLQPVEILTAADGRQTICVYSLGNFISGQHKLVTMLGGMMLYELEFTAEGELVGFSGGVMPLITHCEGKATLYDVYPIDEYSDELAAKHTIKTWDIPATLKYFKDKSSEILGEHALWGNIK